MIDKLRTRRGLNLEAHESHLAAVLVTPILIAVFGILVIPLLYSLLLSFTDTRSVIVEFNFVGFANYIQAFRDGVFRESMRITTTFVVITNFLKLVFGTMV